MPEFKDHIKQAKHNLSFLENINSNAYDFTDWQVTVCFYSSLHLINAHLAQFQLQYRNHNDVKNALNPEVQISPSKLPENEYVAYVSLQMLSRRSRYLVNEKDNKLQSVQPAFTYEKHLSKAFRHLDQLVAYFNLKYKLGIIPYAIYCPALKPTGLKHFSLKQSNS